MIELIAEEDITLTAKNSSGEQILYVDKWSNEEECISFTLIGSYNDEDIQIDFDSISIEEFRKFVAKLYKLSKAE